MAVIISFQKKVFILIFVIKDKQTDIENLEMIPILNSDITYHGLYLKSMRP